MTLVKMAQADRYSHIALAAKDLFAELGFAATTMDKIAKRLGIGRTTLYDYFQSKDDMLYYLIDQRIDLDEQLCPDGSLETQLRQLMAASLTRFMDNYILYKILFTEKPVFANRTSNKILQWQQTVLATVSRLLAEAVAGKQLSARCPLDQMVFVFQALLGQRMSQLLLNPQELPSYTGSAADGADNIHPLREKILADWIQAEAASLTGLMLHGIGELA